MAAVDFGTALAVINGFPRRFSYVNGPTNLAYSLARRLQTVRSTLVSNADYGLDLREFVGASATPQQQFQLQAQVEAECEKDARVDRCTATFDFSFSANKLKLSLRIDTDAGPFDLVFSITKQGVTVDSILQLLAA